jgi:DNA-binding response OmpR family regulator
MKDKEKILIVDDEPTNLEFFNVMLSKLGFDVEQAENGEEALEKTLQYHPDLIILDNIMPGLTGWEVTKRLKQDDRYSECRDIPVIMFSAMDSVEDKIEGYELGVEDYITKPFNFSEVLARIRAVLRSRELSMQVSRRERRIAVIESLNKSLIFFTQHIRKPIEKLLEASRKLDAGSTGQVDDLIKLIQTEAQETLATISGLEDEIEELRNQESELREGELTLEDLESKFRKHFLNSEGLADDQ